MLLPPRAALAALLVIVAGCAATSRALYDPEGFRADVRARAPRIVPEDVVVPWEVPESHAVRARRITEATASDRLRVRLLVNAMFEATAWGLRYSPRGATASAVETLNRRAGNCLDLASVFIGLSRAAGLKSSYMDASRRVRETRSMGDGLTVSAGHITAVVETERGEITLDFASEGEILSYRAISDLEALAHFYNNRGFERIEAAGEEGTSPDWAEAARDFERAVQVFPGFARAWNNLGIAAARLGRHDESLRHYRTAIARDAWFAAPHRNLALLLLHDGDREGARVELERALELRRDDPEVEALLRSLR